MSGDCSSASSSSNTRSAEAMPDWNVLTIDGDPRQRLREAARVLEERLDVADRHRAVGDADAAEHGDRDEVEVADEHRRRLDHAGDELGPEAGLVELVVGCAERFFDIPLAAERLDDGVAGERLFDLAVEPARCAATAR